MPIRVKDIAEAAGVSVATVSLVLNNKGNLSSEVRQRVISVSNTLGYDRSRTRAKIEIQTFQFMQITKHGHILNAKHNEFVTDYIRGVQRRTQDLEITLKIAFYNDLDSIENTLAKNDLQVDGLIILATELDFTDMNKLSALPIPKVAIDATYPVVATDFVDMDNQDSVYRVLAYLTKVGHQSIGLVKSRYQTPNFLSRERAFWDAQNQFSFKVSPTSVYEVDSTFEGAYKDMKELLKNGKPEATSLFCVNDIVAYGVLQALTESGYRVPQDISLVGFDNLQASRYSNPPLTSVEVPKEQIGSQAVDILLARIQRPDSAFTTTLIQGSLVERKSVLKIR